MTVTYTLKVSDARLCGFAKLLLRWRGSIYKLLYREMIIFIVLYYCLSALYLYGLETTEQKRAFERIVVYCDKFTDLIPLSFVLGFYVSIVVGRWWQQFTNIPWPDSCSILIASHVHGLDERGRMIRRTLVRYLCLMMALTFQAVSTRVKKRFPTQQHIVSAGLMTIEEYQLYDETGSRHGKWWMPAPWFSALIVRARKEGRIKSDLNMKTILDELLVFREKCSMLIKYDWISVPLVYTQVVTIAIYTFFLATLMGKQYVVNGDSKSAVKLDDVEVYFPIFTLLQFFFYMGWIKVAEQLINPFGEDDDDFDVNWCLDRAVQIGLLIVDEMFMKHPKLTKDHFWDEASPRLPYTKSSVGLRSLPYLGSTAQLNVDYDASFMPMKPITEQDFHSNPSTPMNLRKTGQLDRNSHFGPSGHGHYMGSISSLASIKKSLLDLRFGGAGRKSSSHNDNNMMIHLNSVKEEPNNVYHDMDSTNRLLEKSSKPVITNATSEKKVDIFGNTRVIQMEEANQDKKTTPIETNPGHAPVTIPNRKDTSSSANSAAFRVGSYSPNLSHKEMLPPAGSYSSIGSFLSTQFQSNGQLSSDSFSNRHRRSDYNMTHPDEKRSLMSECSWEPFDFEDELFELRARLNSDNSEGFGEQGEISQPVMGMRMSHSGVSLATTVGAGDHLPPLMEVPEVDSCQNTVRSYADFLNANKQNTNV